MLVQSPYARADEALGAEQPATDSEPSTRGPADDQSIVVIGSRVIVKALKDVEPEQTYDEAAVQSYDVSTVGELLDRIRRDNGDEIPSVLVNGRPVKDFGELANLPIEVLRRIEALPRGSAQRIGGAAGERAYNIVLKTSDKSATVTLSRKAATEGAWGENRAEVLLNYIQGQDRFSVTLRHTGSGMLFESDREFIPQREFVPYSALGNVIPSGGFQVDPSLSSLAGEPVTTVALSGRGVPTTAELLGGANRINASQAGDYRTLRSSSSPDEIAIAGNRVLTRWLSVSFNGRLNWNRADSLRGLPSAQFLIGSDNAFTPFTTPVLLALNDPLRPLRSKYDLSNKTASVTFNADLGSWYATLLARYDERKSTYRSILNSAQPAGYLPVERSTNPFDGALARLIPTETSVSTSRNLEREIAFDAQGPLFKLAAGVVSGRVGIGALWTSFDAVDALGPRSLARRELTAKAGVTIPLTGPGFLPAVGTSELSLDLARQDFGRFGAVDRYAVALNWTPVKWLRVAASEAKGGNAIYIDFLAAPAVVTENVLYFDPLRNETATVRLIAGGAANLENQTQRTRNLSVTASPYPKWNLQLTADYQEIQLQNLVGGLPFPSSAIVAAFPDRFIRDSSGRLTVVNASSVNFARQNTRQLRLGINLRVPLEAGRALPKTGTLPARQIPATTLQVNVSHAIVLGSTTIIRDGLPEVDLLSGGAIGIGGGQQRHATNGSIALTRGATGVRVDATWRGPSYLSTGTVAVPDRLSFGALLKLDARLFADVGALLPRENWAKSTRITLAVENIANRRQRITDVSGATPLSYQPAYRDPLGRTVMFELRKVF